MAGDRRNRRDIENVCLFLKGLVVIDKNGVTIVVVVCLINVIRVLPRLSYAVFSLKVMVNQHLIFLS